MELRLDHVTMRYRKKDPPALDDVSLTVGPGEFMVVIGESGAGKSTLLRVIAGLEDIESGDIFIQGTYANDLRPGRRGVEMIFQGLALWPHMKVLDASAHSNISFPLKVRRWTKEQISERIRQVAGQVRLSTNLFDRKPQELSGGEQQRVALARAMVTESRIYVMDEPLSNLDPINRVKIRDEIRRLHAQTGYTVVFVTHNIQDALALGDRIAVMREGRIVQVAPPEILWRQPATPYVTELLQAV